MKKTAKRFTFESMKKGLCLLFVGLFLGLVGFGGPCDFLSVRCQEGVKAQAYLSDNSPKNVIDLAKKHLGENNVIIFKD